MKRLGISFLLIFSVYISSAQKAQCPPGAHVGGGWNIDKFNFHKPRTDCKSGFGVCLRTTSYMLCRQGFSTVKVSPVTGTIVHAMS